MTKRTICRLDDVTINKIAAGEVVENPASVVKELVENSLDAGARTIEIEMRGGGRQLIRITDDGKGMSSEDAKIAFERHATSKIEVLEDLNGVMTLGFRGEALPSIASVAKVKLTTCLEGAHQGTLISIEGGVQKSFAKVPCEKGTTIEVRELFFNVPVRKKFLKSPAYDATAIYKTISRLALSYPGVRIMLKNEEKVLLKTTGSCVRKTCAAEVLGSSFSESCRSLSFKGKCCTIEGLIGAPHLGKKNRTGQYLFVNGRSVLSPLISQAVSAGYGFSLSKDQHPIFLLYLTVDGKRVDVNVHPQKREVRWHNGWQIQEEISLAVERAFYKKEESKLHKPLSVSKPLFSAAPPMRPPPKLQEESFRYFSKEDQLPTLCPVKGPRVLHCFPGFLLLSPEQEGALFSLMDQRALAARLLFDLWIKEEKVQWRSLLFPHTFELSFAQGELLRAHLSLVEELGLRIREKKEGVFVVDAISSLIPDRDLEAVVEETIKELEAGAVLKGAEKEKEKRMARLANCASIKYKEKLSHEEAEQLIEQWVNGDHATHAPTGEAIFISVNREDLHKWFQQ